MDISLNIKERKTMIYHMAYWSVLLWEELLKILEWS